MSKYINTNDLELEVSHYLQCEKESEVITLEELKEITNRLPSFEHYRGADMCDFYIDVEVVRCKDCRRYATDNKGEQYCPFIKGLRKPKPDDFCSYGERREADE